MKELETDTCKAAAETTREQRTGGADGGQQLRGSRAGRPVRVRRREAEQRLLHLALPAAVVLRKHMGQSSPQALYAAEPSPTAGKLIRHVAVQPCASSFIRLDEHSAPHHVNIYVELRTFLPETGAPYLALPWRARSKQARLHTSPMPSTCTVKSRTKRVIASAAHVARTSL